MHAQQDHDAERQLQHNVAGENGFALIGRDLRFLATNATMAVINGLSVADYVGCTIAETLPALAPTLEPLLRQVFATGEPIIDIAIPSACEIDGQLQRWLVSCYPVRSRCGAVTAIDMFVHELPAHFKPLSDPLHHAELRGHEHVEEIDPSTLLAGAEDQHRMPEKRHDAIPRKPVKIARPNSEDRWRSLLNNIDQGFCILEMLYDDTGQAIDYQFLDVNPTFERHTGLKDAVGKTARELVPGLETHWVETYAQVAETGEPLRFEQGSAAMGRWFEVDAVRVGGADSREVALLFTDTTARMQADNDARLLSEASEQIRVSTDTDALLWAVTQLIGHYMHVSRCCFVEVNDQANQWTVHRDYRAPPTLPSIAGTHALSPYPPALVAALRAGRVVAIGDTRSDPKTAASHQTGFQPLGIRAFVSIPLLREGQWVAGFVAFAAEPRDWTTREIALFETIIERTWNAVEQMRILEALHESQARLALALQAGHAGTFEWDIRRNVNRWSPEIEALYGLVPGSFEGDYQAWFKRVDPNDAHAIEAGLQAALQLQQHEYVYEFRAILPDQTQRWLEGRARFNYDADGQPLRMLGINVDIDQRKRSEEAIRHTHERLTLALDRLDGFVYEHDVGADAVWRSDGFARVLGYEPEAIPAHSAWWVEQIHPDDRAIATGHLLAAQQNDAAGYSVEYRVRHRDGHFLTFWDRGMIERDAQGRAVRVLGTSMNITQRKQADAEREELLTKVQQALQTMELALAKAEEATRERDTLISIAAHDLRTPLTVIFGRAPMLCQRAEQIGLDERNQRTLATIVGQADRLNQMIGALLDISRIQDGRLTIQPDIHNLAALLKRVVIEMRSSTTAHQFTLGLPETPLMIFADPLRIEQVFHNLLGNAVKYSPAGGMIEVGAEVDAGAVQVHIRDQGIGIPASALSQVFMRFYRAPNATAQSTSSLGVGLYIVRELVQAHGGTISVESAEGEGSTFVVRLPLLDLPASNIPS